MLSDSKLKTWLRLNKFVPSQPRNQANWRNCMKYGIFSRNGRLFRIRDNDHEFHGGSRRWTVDVSCLIPDFDRWANSQDEHSIPIEEFMLRFK